MNTEGPYKKRKRWRWRARQVATRFELVDDDLVRTVFLDDGRNYVHSCSRKVLEEVAWAMEEHPNEGVRIPALIEELEVPESQVYVARDFLLDRGWIEVRHHRCYPAYGDVHLNAMCDFYALAEQKEES